MIERCLSLSCPYFILGLVYGCCCRFVFVYYRRRCQLLAHHISP